MTSRSRALALAFLAVSLCAHPAPAQAPAPPQPPQGGEVFADSIDVNVVNIDVSVTDRRGKWVSGLTRDDFEVYEDGKPVEITYFYASEMAAGPRPEGAPAVPAPERLQLAVYFDLESLPVSARPELATAVEEFLVSRAGPRDKVLLAAYNGADTLLVRELPASRPVLAAALQEMVRTGRLAPVNQQEERLTAMSDSAVDLGGSEELDTAIALSNQYVAEFDGTVQRLMDRMKLRSALQALEGFVANLGSRPGRKALLFVSGGITFRPGQSIVQAFETKLGAGAREGPLSFLVRDVDLAASSDRIAFYALGAPRKGVAPSSISARRNTPPPNAPVLDQFREITDANPATSLAWIDEDLASYYSLGYTPAARQPGQQHRVEVKVKRRGLHARHIERYRERTPGEQARNRTAATLQMGGGENPLGARVRMDPAGPEQRGRVLVPVTLEIPLSRVALLPGEGGTRHGSLSILITARDSQGRMAAVSDTELPLKFDGPLPPGISYTFQLQLRATRHKIVLGVWDEVGNLLSTVTSHYDPAR